MKPKATETYLLKLTPEQKAWLEEIAANSDIPISQVIMNALKQCNFKEPFPAQRRKPGERDEPGRDRKVELTFKQLRAMEIFHSFDEVIAGTKHDKESNVANGSALQALRKRGFLNVRRRQDVSGRWRWYYTLTDAGRAWLEI